jgi:hypothetical protein
MDEMDEMDEMDRMDSRGHSTRIRWLTGRWATMRERLQAVARSLMNRLKAVLSW